MTDTIYTKIGDFRIMLDVAEGVEDVTRIKVLFNTTLAHAMTTALHDLMENPEAFKATIFDKGTTNVRGEITL